MILLTMMLTSAVDTESLNNLPIKPNLKFQEGMWGKQ